MTREHFVAASGLYRLLGRLWLREVDAELLTELQTKPLCDLYQQAGGWLWDGQVDQRELLEELAAEYCRLFVGPAQHSPPYQSVWMHGQFESSTTAQMADFFDLLSYERPIYADDVINDHLGIQLDFMAHLYQQMVFADGNSEAIAALKEIATQFLARHLCWPARLFESVRRRAESPFYAAMIRMTGDVLASETGQWLTAVESH